LINIGFISAVVAQLVERSAVKVYVYLGRYRMVSGSKNMEIRSTALEKKGP